MTYEIAFTTMVITTIIILWLIFESRKKQAMLELETMRHIKKEADSGWVSAFPPDDLMNKGISLNIGGPLLIVAVWAISLIIISISLPNTNNSNILIWLWGGAGMVFGALSL